MSEELEHGKINFRCRIESFWTLPAKIFAATIFVLIFGLVTLFAEQKPWIWMTLAALPLVCWMLDAVIDSTAKDQLLTRLNNQP